MNASSRKPYRSDQADVHWETLLESGRWLGGQPRGAVLREVVNAILYVARTGVPSDDLPLPLEIGNESLVMVAKPVCRPRRLSGSSTAATSRSPGTASRLVLSKVPSHDDNPTGRANRSRSRREHHRALAGRTRRWSRRTSVRDERSEPVILYGAALRTAKSGGPRLALRPTGRGVTGRSPRKSQPLRDHTQAATTQTSPRGGGARGPRSWHSP